MCPGLGDEPLVGVPVQVGAPPTTGAEQPLTAIAPASQAGQPDARDRSDSFAFATHAPAQQVPAACLSLSLSFAHICQRTGSARQEIICACTHRRVCQPVRPLPAAKCAGCHLGKGTVGGMDTGEY